MSSPPSSRGETRARFGGLRPRAWRSSHVPCFFAHPAETLLEAGELLVLFALLAQFVPAHPMALDTRWSTWMRDLETPAPKQVALIFNTLGMVYWRVVPLVAVGLLLVLARQWAALTAFALSAALTLFGSDLIKTWVDRPRPPRHIVPVKGASFPSSHAAYAAMLALTLILVLTEPSRRRLLWLVPAALVIACMAWSRTYLQVHWLSDAAAGSLLGIGVTLASFSAVQLLFGRATGIRRLRSGRQTRRFGPRKRADRAAQGTGANARREARCGKWRAFVAKPARNPALEIYNVHLVGDERSARKRTSVRSHLDPHQDRRAQPCSLRSSVGRLRSSCLH